MTSRLEAAITAIQPLSSNERQTLLQILQSNVQVSPSQELEHLSMQFHEGFSLDELRAQQRPKVVEDISDLKADFWPTEDSSEEFLEFLAQTRREAA